MTSRPTADRNGGADSVLARLVRTEPARFAGEMARMPLPAQVRSVVAMAPDVRALALTRVDKPMRLVRAIPAPDLYLTLRDVGPLDSLPLLQLASREQIQHLLDLESWRHDRFDGLRAGAWAAVLVEAGEPTLRRFVRSADDSELALLFQRWARVEQIEFDDQVPVHGHGGTEAGDELGIVSPDGYHRFRPEIAEHRPAILNMAVMLFREDPVRYQRVLWAALSELPAQLEEDALRWRSSRLEEHGYPPIEEALEIYAPPEEDPPPPPPVIDSHEDDRPVAALYPLAAISGDSRLAGALAAADAELRDAVASQLVALAARVVVADGLDTGDPRTHVRAVRKTAGYVEIGLAVRQAEGDVAVDAVRAVALRELFRRGHARVADLRRRVEALLRDGWAADHPEAIRLLDPPIGPRIEALRLDRPMYFDVAGRDRDGGVRDFLDPQEVDETRGALEIAETVGRVLVRELSVDVGRLAEAARVSGRELPWFSTLVLTMLAWHATTGSLRLDPLPDDVVSDFLRDVASRRTAPPDAAERALAALLDDIARRTGIGPRERGVVAAFGRACLERLTDECAGLDPGAPVDERHVSCLWLTAPGTNEDDRR